VTRRRKLRRGELRALDRSAFVALFGPVLDGSSWVAEAAWECGPFAGFDDVHAAFAGAIRGASVERQLALIRAHPDLAGKAAVAGAVTAESRSEQAGAGLDRLSPDEFDRFTQLNRSYREKFGFPFVLAVKGLDTEAILQRFAGRLGNAPDAERERALAEIVKIARFRLSDLIGESDTV